MARDKRGRPPEPDVDEVLGTLETEESDEFIAGPTTRNEVGNAKRAAAKASGVMGASKKLDPELDIGRAAGTRVKSGSNAGVRGFSEVPKEKGSKTVRMTLSNREIAEQSVTTARKSPASRAARTEGSTGLPPKRAAGGGAAARKRVPAPGTVVDVPKGTLVRGHPTASQSGGKSLSSTEDEKSPKRSARAGTTGKRPVAKGGSKER